MAGAVPTIWNDVMHFLDREPGHDISSLRLVACGGSAVPGVADADLRAAPRGADPAVVGMTETSPMATLAWPAPGTPAEALGNPVPQGRPMCGVEARIVDDQARHCPTTMWRLGLEVRGPWITGSYYRNTDPTKFESGWLPHR